MTSVRSTHIPQLLAIAVPVAVLVTLAGFVLKAAGSIEMPLSERLNAHHHGLVGALGDALYHGIGPVPAIVGTAVVTLLILVVSRSWSRASTFAVTIAGSWLSVAVVKLLVHRPRPDAALLSLPYEPIQIDASYPSGHMAFAAALIVAVILMLRPSAARKAFVALSAVVLVGVAVLLAADGVHYPTDVVASIVWVVAVAPLVFEVWTRLALPWIAQRFPRLKIDRIPTAGPAGDASQPATSSETRSR